MSRTTISSVPVRMMSSSGGVIAGSRIGTSLPSGSAGASGWSPPARAVVSEPTSIGLPAFEPGNEFPTFDRIDDTWPPMNTSPTTEISPIRPRTATIALMLGRGRSSS